MIILKIKKSFFIPFFVFLAITLMPSISSCDHPITTDTHWIKISEPEKKALASKLSLMPDNYSIYTLDLAKIRQHLDDIAKKITNNTLDIPFPDGHITQVTLTEKPTMAPELSAKFPEIRTFQAQVPNRPLVTGVLGIDAQYFHSMLFTEDGRRAFIDHRIADGAIYYISYFDSDYHPTDKKKPHDNVEVKR